MGDLLREKQIGVCRAKEERNGAFRQRRELSQGTQQLALHFTKGQHASRRWRAFVAEPWRRAAHVCVDPHCFWSTHFVPPSPDMLRTPRRNASCLARFRFDSRTTGERTCQMAEVSAPAKASGRPCLRIV